MIYLDDKAIREIGSDWTQLLAIIEEVAAIRARGDSVQPLKPYLRFRDPVNRIIAMPAFVGGSVEMAGIKWIASYPCNRSSGLPRAHNTIILNDPATGEPFAFLNSGRLNGLRTAAVSGTMLRAYLAARQPEKVRLGLIGWGPIGRMHLDMCVHVLGDRLERITLHDLNGIDPASVPAAIRGITDIADGWRAAYRGSNVIATCTVSADRYIDEAPSAGALLLNVSLRDYVPESASNFKAVIVDDWREVCRENTDIEQLHRCCGLQEADTRTLADVLFDGALSGYDAEEAVFFNPMGLAVFDIGVAAYYAREALRQGKGIIL